MKASRRISVCVSSRENAYVDDEDDFEDEDYEDADEYDWALDMERKEAKASGNSSGTDYRVSGQA
jgi:hypothetical protein